MSAWIGPLGNLIEFKCPSAVESTSEDPHVYFRPLGGAVAVTRLGDGTRPRVWDVRVSAARPDHVAALEALSSGEWGPGPFVFIPPAAEALNLLGKRNAMAMGTPGDSYVNERPGTAIPTTEGVAGTGYGATNTTPEFMPLGTAPVLPGAPVTGRAWVRAPAGTPGSLRMVFYTAGNAVLSFTDTANTSNTSGEFLRITATAPTGAAYVLVEASGAAITRPAVTWTDQPAPWAPSAASSNVVISSLSNSVRRATGTPGEAQITDHAFTVQELTA